MPTITFKAKAETIYTPHDEIAWVWVKVPKITKSHCDMNAFRKSRKFGGFANSNMFLSMVARELKKAGIGSHIKLHEIPDNVTVEKKGFFHHVTIEVEG